MRWRTHPHMPATVAARGVRGDYWITAAPDSGRDYEAMVSGT